MWDEMGGGGGGGGGCVLKKQPKMTFNCSESSKHNSFAMLERTPYYMKIHNLRQNILWELSLKTPAN